MVEPTSTVSAADGENTSKSSIRNSEGIVKGNDSTEKRTSSRSGSVSDRAMLVDLFEQTVTDSNEYKALQNYKKNIDRMLALEEKIDRLSAEIKRISFAEGPRDMELLNKLKWQQKNAVRELNKYDNVLLGLEKSGGQRSHCSPKFPLVLFLKKQYNISIKGMFLSRFKI